MSAIFAAVLAVASQVQPDSGPSMGKWAFVGALVLLLVWLLVMPKGLIGQADGAPPWWRNVRVWAIAVTLAQICVYAWFG